MRFDSLLTFATAAIIVRRRLIMIFFLKRKKKHVLCKIESWISRGILEYLNCNIAHNSSILSKKFF